MSDFLPYGRQAIDDDDIAAVVDVLRSDWLTTGPKVEEFERNLAECCGARHAVAVSSGTAALHVSLLAAGIGFGDRVLTSSLTFLASANCAELVGAAVDFADVDPGTHNVTAQSLAACWSDTVRAIVAVDFAGQPCDMPRIADLARRRGAIVVEDAAHALGSAFEYDGRWHRVGGHPLADITTFSFHPVKTITTGEGGAILTDDAELARRCRLYRNHGMTRDRAEFEGLGRPGEEIGPWHYEMQNVGLNYRLSDIQCALGISQLRKLEGWVSRRQGIVDRYNAAFRGLPRVATPCRASGTRCAWHLYVLEIDFEALCMSRTAVMEELRQRGVGTQVHYIPVHLQPYYRRKYGYGPGKCPTAEAFYRRCLSLPLFPAMSDAEVEHVVDAVREVLTR